MPEHIKEEMEAVVGNKRGPDDEDDYAPKKKSAKLRGKTRHRPIFKQPQGEKICPQIVRNVDCPWGNDCRFSHDTSKYLASKPADLEGPCYVFDTFGICPYSFTCRYSGNHTSASGENILDEVKMAQWQDKVSEKNILSMDLQHMLRKKTYDFTKADSTWGELAESMNVVPLGKGFRNQKFNNYQGNNFQGNNFQGNNFQGNNFQGNNFQGGPGGPGSWGGPGGCPDDYGGPSGGKKFNNVRAEGIFEKMVTKAETSALDGDMIRIRAQEKTKVSSDS